MSALIRLWQWMTGTRPEDWIAAAEHLMGGGWIIGATPREVFEQAHKYGWTEDNPPQLPRVIQNADLAPCGCTLVIFAVVVWLLFYEAAPWLLHQTR